MNERDLKNKIKASYEEETPNLLDKIEASCANTLQEPKKIEYKRRPYNAIMSRVVACVACVFLFAMGISLGAFIKKGTNNSIVNTEVDSYVYLDVNPSIELQINSEDEIVSCIAGNEDAEVILKGLSLNEVDMDTALTAIVGSMYLNGYLSLESNSILVSVSSKSDEKKEALLTDITNQINEVFEKTDMQCSIVAQGLSVDEELQKRAEQNNVSVGKMYFVDKMLESDTQRDEKELSKMSIKELNLMYSTVDRQEQFEDVSSGKIGGYVSKEKALDAILEEMLVSKDEISEHRIKAECEFENDSRRMVYEISIKLGKDDKVLKYKVDCVSGEIIKDNPSPQEKPNGDEVTNESPNEEEKPEIKEEPQLSHKDENIEEIAPPQEPQEIYPEPETQNKPRPTPDNEDFKEEEDRVDDKINIDPK